MHETSAELDELQRILDESDAQVVAQLQGVFVPQLATINSSNEPIGAPVDGLFLHGRVWFGLPPRALRIRHLGRNPNVSATHAIGGSVCIITHGVARQVLEGDPRHEAYLDCCRRAYGVRWIEPPHDGIGAGFTALIDPRRMHAIGPR